MTGNDESGFHSKSVSPLARSTPIEIKVIIYKSRNELSLLVKAKTIFTFGPAHTCKFKIFQIYEANVFEISFLTRLHSKLL